MIIVASIAISTMVSNELVLLRIISQNLTDRAQTHTIRRWILGVRRVVIILMMLSAMAFIAAFPLSIPWLF